MTSQVDGHVKTISKSQIIGEHGVALAKERTHAMGFLFTPYGPVEAGIDALIELRDPATGQVGARMVAVQIKTREDRAYTAETDEGFEYVCESADVAYWQKASLPVIVVLVRLSDRSVYWKRAPAQGNPSDLETRRLRINKSADRFDAGTADAIAQLAVDQTQPGTSGIEAADWLAKAAPPEAFVYRTNSLVNQLVAAKSGIGLALLPCYLGDGEDGIARALINPIPELEGELWIVTHVDLRRTARVRAFFDIIGAGLAHESGLFEGMMS